MAMYGFASQNLISKLNCVHVCFCIKLLFNPVTCHDAFSVEDL